MKLDYDKKILKEVTSKQRKCRGKGNLEKTSKEE